jgi:hypothetical protein
VLIACGQVIFVDELDDSNPHGVKGVGEAGIVGVRQRGLPRDRKASARFADYAR